MRDKQPAELPVPSMEAVEIQQRLQDLLCRPWTAPTLRNAVPCECECL